MYTKNIVVIGSSTGGFRVVKRIFSGLPRLNASIIIVQHMFWKVNEQFRNRLRESTRMRVKIAEDGDLLAVGKVYIAPSGHHLKLVNNRQIILFGEEKVNSVRPAIDVTMKSLKNGYGNMIVGVILAGMGKDGVAGISHIKSIGGITIAQDKKTSAIYGMPGAAVETGDVDFSLPPEKIREKLIEVAGTMNG